MTSERGLRVPATSSWGEPAGAWSIQGGAVRDSGTPSPQSGGTAGTGYPARDFSLRVGLDVARDSCGRGLRRYVEGLIHGLEKLGWPGRLYLLQLNDGQPWSPGPAAPCRPLHVDKQAGELVLVLQRERIQVLHITDFYYPLYSAAELRACATAGISIVVTVYDAIPFVLPHQYPAHLELNIKHMLPLLDTASHIIAISRHTEADLVRHLGIPARRISVCPLGVNREIFHDRYPRQAVRALRRRHGLDSPFALYVGGNDPRKNILTLLVAFRTFLNKVREPFQLVLAGLSFDPDHFSFDRQLERYVRQHGLTSHVRFLGWVSPDELPLLYNAAHLLVFPSLYEGFGLPVLEAMACGLPVVAGANSSLPEVAGEAGLLVDVSDPGELAAAMLRVVEEPELRRCLVNCGLVQVARFDWTRTAVDTVSAYRQAVAGRVFRS